MDRSSPLILSLTDAPTQTMRLGRGTTIKLFDQETGARNLDFHINVLNVESGPGPYHYHERAENAYLVLEGTVAIVVEGTRYHLTKDDVAFIPPGLRHRAGNAGNTPAKLIEIYAPAGPDFHIVDDPVEIVDAVR